MIVLILVGIISVMVVIAIATFIYVRRKHELLIKDNPAALFKCKECKLDLKIRPSSNTVTCDICGTSNLTQKHKAKIQKLLKKESAHAVKCLLCDSLCLSTNHQGYWAGRVLIAKYDKNALFTRDCHLCCLSCGLNVSPLLVFKCDMCDSDAQFKPLADMVECDVCETNSRLTPSQQAVILQLLNDESGNAICCPKCDSPCLHSNDLGFWAGKTRVAGPIIKALNMPNTNICCFKCGYNIEPTLLACDYCNYDLYIEPGVDSITCEICDTVKHLNVSNGNCRRCENAIFSTDLV